MRIHSKRIEGEFRHIVIPKSKITGYFPDFLLLGPQRTGTTWLAENLRNHPDIFISYPKELFFLSRLNPQTKSFYAEKLSNSLNSKKSGKTLISLLQFIYMDILRSKFYRKDDIRWYLSFFNISFANQAFKSIKNKTWYQPKVRGEATATNITINEEIIKEITCINPNLKCIIIVRDPVDRAWSHAKKDLARNSNRNYKKIPPHEFESFFNKEYQIECGSYCKNIDKWLKYLKPENLSTIPFSRIANEPEKMMKDVLTFLNVDTDLKYFGDRLKKMVNATEKATVPEKHKEILDNLFKKEKLELRKRYNIDF